MLNGAAVGVFVAMIIARIMLPEWGALRPNVYAWALVGVALNASLENVLSRDGIKRGESRL